MWSKYRQLLTRAHQANQQKEIFLTWTTAICVTFALYLSVWMRFADFGDGGSSSSSSSSGRLVSEGFSAEAASWWCCQLASVVVLLSVDIVVSSDDRLCCLSEDDTLTLPETRMNSGGRDDLPVTGCAFPTTTTATGTTTNTSLTTASSRPRPSPSSSRVVWHSVDTSPPPPLQQQQTRLGRLYDLRVESPAAATPFRSPMSPLKTAGSSASVYLPFGQMAAHAAAAAAALYPPLLPLGRPGFMSGGGGGFFPRLPPLHPPPPQPMTSGLQQPYLTNLNEPYGQSSLIQISQLPPPPPPHPRRPLPIQYPSFLGRLSSSSSLDGDSITGSHVISLHHQQQQQSPSPSLHRMTSAFDPFQRSPMPEPPAQVQRSPVQVHFSDERSQFDRRTQRRGGGGGGGGVTVAPSRSIPHLSTPPSLAARHQGRPSTLTAEIRTPTTSAASRSVQRPEADTSGRSRAEQDPRRTARPSSSPPSGAIEVGAPPPPPPVPPATATCLQPQHPHYPAHFVRGSIIQLSSGQLKRIEDLRTTDFVDSAGISDDLRIDSSTVIHMRQNHERNTVVLGFSVGQQNIQVTVEATLEHPFFVYNQGWSSYSPELTRRRFGLNCHQLNVGNCCISLTQRPPPPPQPAVPPAAQSLRRHRRRPVSSSSPSLAPDPRRGDAGGSGREEEEEENEEEEEEVVVGERHCLSSHGRRFVPGFSGFATHSIGSASLGGPPTTVRSTEVPSAPSAALSGATRAGRKRRWSAPDVFHHHNNPGHHHHQHHQHHHRHRHHRENIPRSSLGEVSEEGGTGRGTSSPPPPPPSFQLPSTES